MWQGSDVLSLVIHWVFSASSHPAASPVGSSPTQRPPEVSNGYLCVPRHSLGLPSATCVYVGLRGPRSLPNRSQKNNFPPEMLQLAWNLAAASLRLGENLLGWLVVTGGLVYSMSTHAVERGRQHHVTQCLRASTCVYSMNRRRVT
ncbi:hypothetical protein B0H19DRAFT_1240753 [Mycena capillaripes]|nr:hypothetical protein B0H19DRAFT_1240753 [Mycena capillaripes]